MNPPANVAQTAPVRELGRENNKIQAGDRAAHDWYRFVLSFPPHLVRSYLERFGAGPHDRVLDPFCGTGTTLVECKKLGIPSVGIEANPMAFFASSVKTDWSISGPTLLNHARRIEAAARSALEAEGIQDGDDLPLFRRASRKTTRLRTLPPDAERLLLRNSISPLPLHKTLVLLEQIEEHRQQRLTAHEKLALAKAVVSQISNLNFGPEVGIGPIKNDAPVLSRWLCEVQSIACDLHTLNSQQRTVAEVIFADARESNAYIRPGSISFVLTSPPYPNEKDYTRTTRLESVLLGFVSNRGEMRALKERLIRSNTRGVYRHDRDDEYVSDMREIDEIANRIETRRIELGKTSGFERLYPRVTKLYFGGMARHLAELRHLLKPGARLAYVVGDQASYLRVMIRTGAILAEIAESLGYKVIEIELFRTRLATATKEQLREEVVLLEWPGRKS
jgi:DNA modification methylase